jgi:hypothetical protein
MSEPFVVSRSRYVDPAKVGNRRRSNSREASRDRALADEVIETPSEIRYRTVLGPKTPTAPPPDDEPDPDPPVSYPPRVNPAAIHTDYSNAICLLVTGLCVLGFGLHYAFSGPVKGKLIEARWAFQGTVAVEKWVVEGGWSLPAGAQLLSEESRVHHRRTVVDRVDVICQDVQKTRSVYSHTDSVCGDEFSHYSPKEEVYSHTDEVCYSNGKCVKDDVYKKVGGKAIYHWVCHQHPRYKNVHYLENVCKNHPITHEEDVFQPHYSYNILRWVDTAPLTLDSLNGSLPEHLLKSGEKLSHQKWTYTLYFQDPNTTRTVSQRVYQEYLQKLGQQVLLP